MYCTQDFSVNKMILEKWRDKKYVGKNRNGTV